MKTLSVILWTPNIPHENTESSCGHLIYLMKTLCVILWTPNIPHENTLCHPVDTKNTSWKHSVSSCGHLIYLMKTFCVVVPVKAYPPTTDTGFCSCINPSKTSVKFTKYHRDSLTCGVMVSMFAVLACHQCYCAGSSLIWGLNLWALVCGIFWSSSAGVFSGYSGFLPSIIS